MVPFYLELFSLDDFMVREDYSYYFSHCSELEDGKVQLLVTTV